MAFVIAAIEGELISVGGQSALIRSGAMTYEVLIPAADAPALAGVIGSNVNFVTLHYLESQGQGSSFWPRLIGFQSVSDRDFFELLTSVKGIGNRKALRALQRSFADIAAMIEQKDFAALQSLPEIGRKTAETIVVELKDKVARFTLGATNPARSTGAAKLSGAVADAVVVLMQLGESRVVAERLAERAALVVGKSAGAEAIVAAALQLKGQA
jgi:holliday junction DNA helicase RuvA